MPEGLGEASNLKDRMQAVYEVWGVYIDGVMALGWSVLTGYCVSCNT